MTEALIRPASHADVPELLRLNRIVHDWHASHYLQAFPAKPNADAVQTMFLEAITDDKAHVVVAEKDGQTCGYLFATHDTSTGSAVSHPKNRLHIEHICVDPEHRGQGFARALLSDAEAFARARGCRDVTLDSWAQNHGAHAAFQAQGLSVARLRFSKDL